VNNGTLSREALTQAIEHRELMIPELLNILESAVADMDALRARRRQRYMAHIYAMFLLAQFRESRAYPWIVGFFTEPGEISLNVTGDLVTEYLGRILASVSCGDISLLKSLIENENVNDYVQYAALESLAILVACGEQSREEIMAYYQYLFRERLEREYSHVWDGLVVTSTELYPEEVYPDIQKAYQDYLVDTTYFTKPEEVEIVLKLGKEKALEKLRNNKRYKLIDDTISEMEAWEGFKPSASRYVVDPMEYVDRSPVVRKKPKISRNQPCPCGSGKKYKRCCGANR
jgi:hypothetical protein